jgi:hypothetical protein
MDLVAESGIVMLLGEADDEARARIVSRNGDRLPALAGKLPPPPPRALARPSPRPLPGGAEGVEPRPVPVVVDRSDELRDERPRCGTGVYGLC